MTTRINTNSEQSMHIRSFGYPKFLNARSMSRVADGASEVRVFRKAKEQQNLSMTTTQTTISTISPHNDFHESHHQSKHI